MTQQVIGILTLIQQLDANKTLLSEAQSSLREFVLDKNFPLEERFRVWKEYCQKENKGYVVHKGSFGIIGEMVDSQFPCEYDRYREYTFEDYLFWIKECEKDKYEKKEWESTMTIPLPSLEEFKEMLIETNFGSFIFDW